MEFLQRNQNNTCNDATHPTGISDNTHSNDNSNTKINNSANDNSFVLNRAKGDLCSNSASRPKILWNNFDNDDDNTTNTTNTAITTNTSNNNTVNDNCNIARVQRQREVSYHDNDNNIYNKDKRNSNTKAQNSKIDIITTTTDNETTKVSIASTLTTYTKK